MNFIINKGSVNPILRMEVVQNGRSLGYNKFYEGIQDADVYFSMRNIESGIVEVSKAKAFIKRINEEGCEEKYAICYNWKKHDVNEYGTFEGFFEIVFNGNLECAEGSYPKGNLIVPIEQRLIIIVK